MGEYVGPLLVTAAAFALTYLCCLRPMLHRSDSASERCCTPRDEDPVISREIAELSQDIQALRDSIQGSADPEETSAPRQLDITN